MSLWERAPWFRASEGDPNAEPLSYRAWKRLWQTASPSWEADLFDRLDATDWDVVVLLDACRYDTLAAVADCAAIGRARSPATATRQFLERAHAHGVFDDTVYVSANPQTSRQSPGRGVEHVNAHAELWDDALRTVPPDPVYDVVRERVGERRVVAHTVQPHYPHICEVGGHVRAVPNGLHPDELDLALDRDSALQVQSALARGQIALDRARHSYRAAVRFAWDRVVALAADLAESGYTTVVTADHGEVFGERGFVEHPTDVPVRELVEVPWLVVRPRPGADDASPGTRTAGDVDDRLAALGYVDER